MSRRHCGAMRIAWALVALLGFFPPGTAAGQPGAEVLVFTAEYTGIPLGTLTITTVQEGDLVRITQTIQPSDFLRFVLAPELEWETILDAGTLELRSMRRHVRTRFHNEEIAATVERGVVTQRLVDGRVITYALPPGGLADDQALAYQIRRGAFPERIYTIASYGPLVTVGQQLGAQQIPGPQGPTLAQGFRFQSFFANGTPASSQGDALTAWIQVAEPRLPLEVDFSGSLQIRSRLLEVREEPR